MTESQYDRSMTVPLFSIAFVVAEVPLNALLYQNETKIPTE